MRKSLIVFVLSLTLFIGTLSVPTMAYYNGSNNQTYNNLNKINGLNLSKVVSVSFDDIAGMLLKLNNSYTDLIGVINQFKPRLPIYTPQPQQPAPTPQPEPKPEKPEPAPQPQPKPEKPEPAPQPEPKPEKPEPAPQPEPKPEKPEPAPQPEPKPEKPEPAPQPETRPEKPAPQGVGGQQGQMLDMVNQERAKNGLKPLIWDANLANVAQVKAKDMSDNNYFDHNSPTYGSPFQMMKKFGITYRAAGENLAGSGSVDRAHLGLMNSEGHRKNILNPNFTHLGIGVEKSTRYGYVYVQMFIGK